MAGKHVGAWQNTNDPLPGFEWNERTTKAYAEGRYNTAPNGHVAGSDAYRAYVAGAANAGDLDQAFESGGGAGSAPAVYTPVFYDANGTNFWRLANTGSWPSGTPVTLSIFCEWSTFLGANQHFFSMGDGVVTSNRSLVIEQTGGQTAVNMGVQDATGLLVCQSASTVINPLIVGQVYHLALSWDGTSNQSLCSYTPVGSAGASSAPAADAPAPWQWTTI